MLWLISTKDSCIVTIFCYLQVAARVTPDGAEKDEWFIVKVMHFDKETKL